MQLIEIWANTRNDSIYALIESELYELYQSAGFSLDENAFEKNLTIEFQNHIKNVWRNRSVKGGNEAILISTYNENHNMIEIFESMGKAANVLEGNQGKISNCIKDGTKHKERIWAKVFEV